MAFLRHTEHLDLLDDHVDSKEKIDAFLLALDEMMTSGLVTIEKVRMPQCGDRSLDRCGFAAINQFRKPLCRNRTQQFPFFQHNPTRFRPSLRI